MKIANLVRFFVFPLMALFATLPPAVYGQTSNSNSFRISLNSPTNGQTYIAPADVKLYAAAVDSNAVRSIAFFSGTNLLFNITSIGSSNSIIVDWGTGPGTYTLTAVGTDSAGSTATSAPVTITVLPPGPIPFAVGWYNPENGQTYTAPATVAIHAWVTDTNLVRTMQYFVNSALLTTITNTGNLPTTNTSSGNPFAYTWTNVAGGSYTLTAVATDTTGATATSAPITISVQASARHPLVSVYVPASGNAFLNPASVNIQAFADEANTTIRWVELFAGTDLLVTVTNTTYLTNYAGQEFDVSYSWPTPPSGNQALTAVAMDSLGNLGTSSVVNISILASAPQVPFAVGWESPTPTNGQIYASGTTIGMHAWVADSNTVSTMQYFANSTLIASFTNTSGVLLTNVGSDPLNLFGFGLSHAAVGTYVLTAVATDSTGATATSPPVTFQVISLTTLPPIVRIISPPNAASFRSPVNIPIYAYSIDTDGYIAGLEFFAGTNDLGAGKLVPRGAQTNSYGTIYYTIWTNAPAGAWALTARATDNSNAVTISTPVNITVLPPVTPPTNPVPIVIISAIDPVAIEGTNCWVWPGLSNAAPNWSNWVGRTMVPFTNCGPKNATFSVYHNGDTNNPLTVTYSIAGTASNGVDYMSLPGSVTIPAGQRLAMISIVPIDDGSPSSNSTVILSLTPSTTSPPAYTLGSRSVAEAIILDGPPISPPPTATASVLPDRTLHLNTSGPNGAWFHIEASTDMQTWTPICTNQVVNGSIDFADPDGSNASGKFYRAVPETNPPQ